MKPEEGRKGMHVIYKHRTIHQDHGIITGESEDGDFAYVRYETDNHTKATYWEDLKEDLYYRKVEQ